jgi:hypothetical protein
VLSNHDENQLTNLTIRFQLAKHVVSDKARNGLPDECRPEEQDKYRNENEKPPSVHVPTTSGKASSFEEKEKTTTDKNSKSSPRDDEEATTVTAMKVFQCCSIFI